MCELDSSTENEPECCFDDPNSAPKLRLYVQTLTLLAKNKKLDRLRGDIWTKYHLSIGMEKRETDGQ